MIIVITIWNIYYRYHLMVTMMISNYIYNSNMCWNYSNMTISNIDHVVMSSPD